MKKILITEFMDGGAVKLLSQSFNVVYAPDMGLSRSDLIYELGNTDALIVRNQTQVDSALLANAHHVVAVGRLGVGLDNIDVNYCKGRGIKVVPAVGANAAAVAEYVVSMSMILMRGFLFSSQSVIDGLWPRANLVSGSEAAGKTLAIVGLGSVGQSVSNLAKAMNMNVIALDPSKKSDHPAWRNVGRCVDLDELLSQADVLTLHIPLTQKNINFIDERELSIMKKTAILINTARGGLVNDLAMINALQLGHLAAAAVDVFTQEPLPSKSVFANCPNLFLTPHISSVTQQSNVRVSALIADRITQYLL